MDLVEDILVLLLSTEEEALHDLLEDVELFDLVTLATCEAECVVEEQVECLVLVLENFDCLHMLLGHVSFRNVCCLIVRHQIKIKQQTVKLVVWLQATLGIELTGHLHLVFVVRGEYGLPERLSPLTACKLSR